jgi:hypothetical protein
MSTVENTTSAAVRYAIRGLERCWLADHGRWSHIYHLDGRTPANESVPPSDVFYTLNVLLGFSRVPKSIHNVNLAAALRHNAQHLLALPVPRYAFGTALWAAAELELELPGNVMDYVRGYVSDQQNWRWFRAQDLGMILAGVVAQARHDPKLWAPMADRAFAFLSERYASSSGLFFDTARGLRRRFASFATQTYLTLACYAYGEFANNACAIELGNAAARRVISSQGPNGEWPWFFDAVSGRVIDFYEVYSVHQYGMAPAFLEYAERHNVSGARGALIEGFRWVLGGNQLGVTMLVPNLQLSIRSQVRRGELGTTKIRMMRAIANVLTGHQSELAKPKDLVLRPECRSYELGWLLWSFGRRADLVELTNDHAFSDAL